MQSLDVGLDAFAEQFRAQLDAAGAPASEHGIHFCLALGFQAAFNLALGTVVFEAPDHGNRIDLVFRSPLDLAVEVKYHRPIPSGRNRPFTQHYGQLLADFNKIAQLTSERRLVVLVTDEAAARHIQRSGHDLLPFDVGDERVVASDAIALLPATAARTALSHGDWSPLGMRLTWRRAVMDWTLLAWSVMPISI